MYSLGWVISSMVIMSFSLLFSHKSVEYVIVNVCTGDNTEILFLSTNTTTNQSDLIRTGIRMRPAVSGAFPIATNEPTNNQVPYLQSTGIILNQCHLCSVCRHGG